MNRFKICNYCTLQTIMRNNGGKILSLIKDPMHIEVPAGQECGFPEGIRVEVDGKFVAWFAELPDHCVC